MRFTPKDGNAPVKWIPRARACRCVICGQLFAGRALPGDRGSLPLRNRARGDAIRHVNAAHGVEGESDS